MAGFVDAFVGRLHSIGRVVRILNLVEGILRANRQHVLENSTPHSCRANAPEVTLKLPPLTFFL
jgi:hypothetical protein